MNLIAEFFIFQILLLKFHILAYRNCNQEEWRCRNGQCIQAELMCNGRYDCYDRSDESPASCLYSFCPKYAFRCSYGACIRRSSQCDGKQDCADNSDEILCPKCINEEYSQCDSGHCIPEEKVCDGIVDCPDKSDETLKRCWRNICPGYSMRCSYGACVSRKSRCNGKRDCIDGSDEIACNNNFLYK